MLSLVFGSDTDTDTPTDTDADMDSATCTDIDTDTHASADSVACSDASRTFRARLGHYTRISVQMWALQSCIRYLFHIKFRIVIQGGRVALGFPKH